MSRAPAVEILEGELRELIQRRDLRPDAGDADIGRLVDEAVADYRDRYLAEQHCYDR